MIGLFFLSLNKNKSVGLPTQSSLPMEGICNVRCAPANDLIDSPKVKKGMRDDLKNSNIFCSVDALWLPPKQCNLVFYGYELLTWKSILFPSQWSNPGVIGVTSTKPTA